MGKKVKGASGDGCTHHLCSYFPGEDLVMELPLTDNISVIHLKIVYFSIVSVMLYISANSVSFSSVTGELMLKKNTQFNSLLPALDQKGTHSRAC